MKRRMVRAMVACVALSALPLSHSMIAHATSPASYAPTGVTSLTATPVNGQPRTVTLQFNAPNNASTSTLSGFFIQYRCLTKATKVAPCTGRWRSVGLYEVDDGEISNGELITATYTLPVGIVPMGNSTRPVSFKVVPIGDTDDDSEQLLLGPSTAISSVAIRDTPVLVGTPLSTSSTGKQRITVRVASPAVDATRGASSLVYTVQYSRNNKSWTTITNGDGSNWNPNPGSSKIVSVNQSGVRYYFRVRLATNAGTVTQDPPKSQTSR